jgi:L-rhamnose mutarotase
MEVICELMRLKPERVQDYLDMHDNTRPELIAAIRDSGFLEEHIYILDNLVIVTMKCEDFAASLQKLHSTAVYQKWTKQVRSMLVDQKIVDLAPVWDLSSFPQEGRHVDSRE